MQHSPGFLALVTDARKRIKECGIGDVRARLDRGEPFHFVDVREDGEFAVDRAAGARHIGRGVLERDVETLLPEKDAPIILYCCRGYRSSLVSDTLQKMEYTDVVSMDGGIRAWREAGYPIERGE